jgi:sulfoxide reductase heme-binding subunit YedZ
MKVGLFAAALGPLLYLVYGVFADGLGANPIDAITDETGTWTLRFLVATLLVTPLRKWTGWNPLIRFRRMLGLFAFFYGTLHFLTYLVLDQFFDLDAIVADIVKRPFITVGFSAFVLMIPLAITSTAGWIGRLGGRRWNLLHKLVYLSAVGGVVHYLWLVKSDISRPARYGVAVALLLATRVWFAYRPGRVAPRAVVGRVTRQADGDAG